MTTRIESKCLSFVNGLAEIKQTNLEDGSHVQTFFIDITKENYVSVPFDHGLLVTLDYAINGTTVFLVPYRYYHPKPDVLSTIGHNFIPEEKLVPLDTAQIVRSILFCILIMTLIFCFVFFLGK